MVEYVWEHVHLRSPDPSGTAEWYRDKLGAEVVKTPQPDGTTRYDLNLTGQQIFIGLAQPGKAAEAPSAPYLGLEHIGLRVSDLTAAVAELKAKGVAFSLEPTEIRPGVRIAFLIGPENISIELLQRN